MANDSSGARTLTDERARSLVEAWRRGVREKLLDRDCPVIEVGTGWDPVLLDNGCSKLLGHLEKLQSDGVKVDAFNFDRIACALMHEEMRLPPKVSASDGFWRWLAVAKLPAVIEARHGNLSKGIYAHLGNYGIGTRNIRNRLRVLWLRANMLYDANAPDPYRLAKRFLHTDFIESGIIRHRWGWCRNLARVLVRFQYRHPKSKAVHLHSTDSFGIRRLYRRLQFLHSVYAFEFMSDQELWEVLEKHSQDLTRAR